MQAGEAFKRRQRVGVHMWLIHSFTNSFNVFVLNAQEAFGFCHIFKSSPVQQQQQQCAKCAAQGGSARQRRTARAEQQEMPTAHLAMPWVVLLSVLCAVG